jgi:poly(A) polymerase
LQLNLKSAKGLVLIEQHLTFAKLETIVDISEIVRYKYQMSTSRTQKPSLHEAWIDSQALKIVNNLKRNGYETYLVGGCVRDLLIGLHPKDFDIATDAQPNQVKRIVPHSYIIGRRFRLVLVRRGDHQFEIATFRRPMTAQEIESAKAQREENSGPIGDNFFGTPEEDARRRDFTVNGLFYDTSEHRVIDHINGLADIESRTLRMIGDPVERLREDPIRALRALRLSHKIGFSIESELRQAMLDHADAVLATALPRRREEFLKTLRLPDSSIAFCEMWDLKIMNHILPWLAGNFANDSFRDEFLYSLRHLTRDEWNLDDPMELMTAFAYFTARSKYPDEKFLIEKIRDDLGFEEFLRNELGMFRAEIGHFIGCCEMMSSLANRESFLRKGDRRKKAFVENEFFDLSLRLAFADKVIDSSTFQFWNEVDYPQTTEKPDPSSDQT